MGKKLDSDRKHKFNKTFFHLLSCFFLQREILTCVFVCYLFIFLNTIEVLSSSLLSLFCSPFFGRTPSPSIFLIDKYPWGGSCFYKSLIMEIFRDVILSSSFLWAPVNYAQGWSRPLLVKFLAPFTLPSF